MANNQDIIQNLLDQKDNISIEIKNLEKDLLDLEENEGDKETKALMKEIMSQIDTLNNDKDDIERQITDALKREEDNISNEVEQEPPSKMTIDRLTQIRDRKRQAFLT